MTGIPRRALPSPEGGTDRGDAPRQPTAPAPGRRAFSPAPLASPDEPREHVPSTPSPEVEAAAVVERPARRRVWPWLVLAVLLASALTAAWLVLRRETPADNPGPSEVPREVAFLTPAQLSALGSEWRVTADVAHVEEGSPTARCLEGTTQRLPRADASSLRTLGASDGSVLLHRLDTYASRSVAMDAFAARRAQLATCDSVVHIVGAHEVLGLGDDALILEVVAEAARPVAHTIMLLRTGRGIDVVDLARPGTAGAPRELAALGGALVQDHCELLAGTCASGGVVTSVPPPAGADAGFLLPADLPQVSPGVGRWLATAPAPRIDLVGSLCETTKLADVPARRKFQRTLILTDDPSAGTAFGVDSVVYQLGSPQEAAELAKKVVDEIVSCPGRLPTATVEKVGQVKGLGDKDPVTATIALVTQRPAGTTAVFRVGVAAVADRVVYLVETPKEGYGLSEAQWADVVVRAGQRAAQLP